LTHDLGPSVAPANLEINPPKPQPLEAFSYPTPQSAAPSPDVGTDTLSSDFSTPVNVDPFQLFGVPRPTYSYLTQSTIEYTSQTAPGLDSSTLHNTAENIDGISIAPQVAELAVLNFQAAEQYSTLYVVDDPAEQNQCGSPSLSPEALQHSQVPQILSIDRAQSMTLVFPDLSSTKLRQVVELGDRLFPQDLTHLETQVNHWQAEGLWSFVDFGFLPGSSTK
jgi:hypothetical protein